MPIFFSSLACASNFTRTTVRTISTLSAPMREYAAPAYQDTKSQQLINEYFEIRHHRTHSKSGKIQCLEFHFKWPCKHNVEWSNQISTVINQYTQGGFIKRKWMKKVWEDQLTYARSACCVTSRPISSSSSLTLRPIVASIIFMMTTVPPKPSAAATAMPSP